MGARMKNLVIGWLLLSSGVLFKAWGEDAVPSAPSSHQNGTVNSGREEAGDIDDPRKKKGDRYFKSFESLEGGKSENPSFDVGFPGERAGETNRCGATVVKQPSQSSTKKDESSCIAVTAAHCVELSFGKTVKVKTGYGDISAKITPHPVYEKAHKNATSETKVNSEGYKRVVSSEKPFDIAILNIQDSKFCKEAPKVSVCKDEPRRGQQLAMGSSWMGKLMSGGIPPDAGQGVHGDFIDTVIGTDSGVNLSANEDASKKGISQGDSGSGGFIQDKTTKELCLFGALSGTGQKIPANPPLPRDFSRDASYAAGKKVLEFINGFLQQDKAEAFIREAQADLQKALSEEQAKKMTEKLQKLRPSRQNP